MYACMYVRTYTCVYIYVGRERERERERDGLLIMILLPTHFLHRKPGHTHALSLPTGPWLV